MLTSFRAVTVISLSALLDRLTIAEGCRSFAIAAWIA
jgi:hypothetical protein